MLSVPEALCRLSANAPRYFPELSGGHARASLKQRHERNASSLWHVELVAQDQPMLRRAVVVKWPWLRDVPRETGTQRSHNGLANGCGGNAPPKTAADRPRLALPCPPAEKCRREYDALLAIERRFDADTTGRFAALRPLDHWADDAALVMEEVPHPSLKSLLSPSWRPRGLKPTALTAVMNNAGAWLRAFHELPPPASSRPRHTQPRDLVGFVTRLVDYLEGPREHGGLTARRSSQGSGWHGRLLRHALGHVRRFAAVRLPEELPLGLGHGDFAPRNLFVLPGGRVAGFDTLARWQPPIYEDLGDFLADVWTWTAWPFRVGSSARQMRELEGGFLRGYFARRRSHGRRSASIKSSRSWRSGWVSSTVAGWPRDGAGHSLFLLNCESPLSLAVWKHC